MYKQITNHQVLTGVKAGLLLLVLGFLAAAAPVSRAADKPIDETRAAPPTGRVDIENVAGKVTISGWGQSQVSVKGTLAEDCTLDFTNDGDRTIVHVKCPESRRPGFSRNHGESTLDIKVPSGSAVSASTVSAGIDVSGVAGDLNLETVSGDLSIQGNPSRVESQSVSGKIDVLASTKRVSAESVSGDILIRGPEREMDASVVSGGIRVEGGSFRSVEASAVSGDVLFDAALEDDARCEISSHSGTVDMTVPANTSAEFELQTFSGDIRTDFGKQGERTSKYGPGKTLDFTIGSGSARVELNSFSGTVLVRKK